MSSQLCRQLFSIPLLVIASLGTLGNSTLSAQTHTSDDYKLVLGTWSLMVDESSHTPGPIPMRQTRVYVVHEDGIEVNVETVDAKNKTSKTHYVADYNSLEYPVSGSPFATTVTLKRINERVAEAILRHARKEIGSARRVISEDGNKMTITIKGSDRDGRTFHNVSVYKKVQDDS